jgi:hypothetical protein
MNAVTRYARLRDCQLAAVRNVCGAQGAEITGYHFRTPRGNVSPHLLSRSSFPALGTYWGSVSGWATGGKQIGEQAPYGWCSGGGA